MNKSKCVCFSCSTHAAFLATFKLIIIHASLACLAGAGARAALAAALLRPAARARAALATLTGLAGTRARARAALALAGTRAGAALAALAGLAGTGAGATLATTCTTDHSGRGRGSDHGSFDGDGGSSRYDSGGDAYDAHDGGSGAHGGGSGDGGAGEERMPLPSYLRRREERRQRTANNVQRGRSWEDISRDAERSGDDSGGGRRW